MAVFRIRVAAVLQAHARFPDRGATRGFPCGTCPAPRPASNNASLTQTDPGAGGGIPEVCPCHAAPACPQHVGSGMFCRLGARRCSETFLIGNVLGFRGRAMPQSLGRLARAELRGRPGGLPGPPRMRGWFLPVCSVACAGVTLAPRIPPVCWVRMSELFLVGMFPDFPVRRAGAAYSTDSLWCCGADRGGR